MIKMIIGAHDLLCVLKVNEVLGNLSSSQYEDITIYCKKVGLYRIEDINLY